MILQGAGEARWDFKNETNLVSLQSWPKSLGSPNRCNANSQKKRKTARPPLPDIDTIQPEDSTITEHSIVSSESSLSRFESFPAELLQQIAWYAHNPLLYLVSKTITSKLLPLEHYEHDLILLLWCDRHQMNDRGWREECHYGVPTGWNLVMDEDFPWRMPMAKHDNPKPSSQQRLQIQKDVFDLAWLTEAKFRAAAELLMSFWLNYRIKDEDIKQIHCFLEAPQPCDLEDLHRLRRTHDWMLARQMSSNRVIFTQEYTRRNGPEYMFINRGCKVRTYFPDRRSYWGEYLDHALMDNLYIPSYVFESPKCSTDDLLLLMRQSRMSDIFHCMGTAPIFFSKKNAVAALRSAITLGDRLALIRVFSLLLSQVPNENIDSLNPTVHKLLVSNQPRGADDGVRGLFHFHPLDGTVLRTERTIDDVEILDDAEYEEARRIMDELVEIVRHSNNLEQCVGLA